MVRVRPSAPCSSRRKARRLDAGFVLPAGSEKFAGCRESAGSSDATLDPDLVDPLVLPIGEQTNTIAARLNFVEMSSSISASGRSSYTYCRTL